MKLAFLQSQTVLSQGAEHSLHLAVKVIIPPSANKDEAQSHITIMVGELSDAWRKVPLPHFTSSPSLAQGIRTIVEGHGQGVKSATIILAPKTQVFDTGDLIEAIEALNGIDLPLSIISCGSYIDHRLLSQFATLSGGECALLRKPEDWGDYVERLLQKSTAGAARAGFLTVDVPAMMNIERLYTISPQPGLVHISVTSRAKNSISFPLLSYSKSANEQVLLLTVSTPPLASGNYRLASLRCTESLSEDGREIDLVQANFCVRNSIQEPQFENLEPTRLADKIKIAAQVEMIAQAYLREDGASITHVLKGMERQLLSLGLRESSMRIRSLRTKFIHRGSFSLGELNETWLVLNEVVRTFKVGV